MSMDSNPLSQVAPHHCPDCGAPAYNGAFTVECTNPGCRHYHKGTAVKHWSETIDERLKPTEDSYIVVGQGDSDTHTAGASTGNMWLTADAKWVDSDCIVSGGSRTISDDDIDALKDALKERIIKTFQGHASRDD